MQIKHLTRGPVLLGSPAYGEDDYIKATVARRIEKVIEAQSHLSDLDHPQVKLQLLRSCLNVCKINNLLRTKFDASLRDSIELITRSSIQILLGFRQLFQYKMKVLVYMKR